MLLMKEFLKLRLVFVPNASSLSPETRFFALFVGESGSGKTVAEASFAQCGKLQCNDFDGRIRGILGAPWLTEEIKKNIQYDSFPPKMDGLIERLNQNFEVMMINARTGKLDITTHLTDSITSMNQAFISQAKVLTHPGKPGEKGKWLGAISMAGPEDYGLEATACSDYISSLKSLQIPNVIVSAHIIDKYGKLPDSEGKINSYSESVVIGEKLSIRDKIGENIKIHFDHIFKFDRITINGKDKFYVTFRGDIARTSYSQLPDGKYDITDKDFYKELMRLVGKKESVASVAT